MGDPAGASTTAPAQPDVLATSLSAPPATTTSTTTTTTTTTHHHAPAQHQPLASRTSIDSTHSSLQSQAARKEYLDSLVVPSRDEVVRIAEIQNDREAEQRRRSRELRHRQRQSLDARGTAAIAVGCAVPASTTPRPSTSKSSQRNDAPPPNLAERLGLKDLDLRRLDDLARSKAAVIIQRHYRGYRARREMNGLGINANTRWVHAIREARYRELIRPRARAEVELLPGQPAESMDGAVGSALGAEAESVTSALDRPMVGQGARRESNAMRNWKKATSILRYASLDQDSDSDTDDDAESDSDSDSEADSEPRPDSESQGPKPSRRRTSEDRQRERARVAAARARRRKYARMMDLQYFLEMIDVQHRYGANLRTYHEEWKRSDTKENFFYWLDYGEGRLVDMAACPRARLAREQVRYLSREERQYYLVKIDKEGRLCWAKNGARIDTTVKWKDSIHGIVPVDDPTPAFKPVMTTPGLGDEAASAFSSTSASTHHHHHHQPRSDSESEADSGSDVSESELAAARAAKYALTVDDDDDDDGTNRPSSGAVKKVRHFSAATVFDALLRKSVQKNTWIFVADTSLRLYVGIKDSGAFQHSSFLHGARISAAGLIKIRNGRLASLSPLSGHYRPPAANFRAFLQSLREEGVDMRHVSISKAYAVLVGLEAYMKTRQRGKKWLRRLSLHRHRTDKDENGDHQKRPSTAKPNYDVVSLPRGTGDREKEMAASEGTTAADRLLQKLHIRSASHDEADAEKTEVRARDGAGDA